MAMERYRHALFGSCCGLLFVFSRVHVGGYHHVLHMLPRHRPEYSFFFSYFFSLRVVRGEEGWGRARENENERKGRRIYKVASPCGQPKYYQPSPRYRREGIVLFIFSFHLIFFWDEWALFSQRSQVAGYSSGIGAPKFFGMGLRDF